MGITVLYLLPLKEANWVPFIGKCVHAYLYGTQLASFSGNNYSYNYIAHELRVQFYEKNCWIFESRTYDAFGKKYQIFVFLSLQLSQGIRLAYKKTFICF